MVEAKVKSPNDNVLHMYIVTYLHTPWSRFLLQKLTGFQLVKKFLAFYGTRRVIIAFTSARHLSLSWTSSIQYIRPHPTSWRPILILMTIHSKQRRGTVVQLYSYLITDLEGFDGQRHDPPALTSEKSLGTWAFSSQPSAFSPLTFYIHCSPFLSISLLLYFT